jgi:hypothetical protein
VHFLGIPKGCPSSVNGQAGFDQLLQLGLLSGVMAEHNGKRDCDSRQDDNQSNQGKKKLST